MTEVAVEVRVELTGETAKRFLNLAAVKRLDAADLLDELMKAAIEKETYKRENTLPLHLLTERRLAILQGFAAGKTVKEISLELSFSTATMKREVRCLLDIFGANDRTGAIARAYQLGVL